MNTHVHTHLCACTHIYTKIAVWAQMRNSSKTIKITLLAKDKRVLIKTLTHYLFLEKPGKNEKISQHDSRRHTGLLCVQNLNSNAEETLHAKETLVI